MPSPDALRGGHPGFVPSFISPIAVDGKMGQAKDMIQIVPPDLEKIPV